jgi:hypothetical protein
MGGVPNERLDAHVHLESALAMVVVHFEQRDGQQLLQARQGELVRTAWTTRAWFLGVAGVR